MIELKKSSQITPELVKNMQSDPRCHIGNRVTIEEGASIYLDPQFKSLVLSDGVAISRGTHIEVNRDGELSLGKNVTIGRDSTIAAMCSITVGDGVGIANSVSIRDHNHCVNSAEHTAGKERSPWASGFEAAPIVIEPMAIISDRVRVSPGVRIGQNTLIGADVHLRQSVPPNCKIVGDAKSIRIIEHFSGEMGAIDMKDIRFSFYGDSLVDRPAIVVDNPHYDLPAGGEKVVVRGHETAGFYKLVLQRLIVAFPERSFEFLKFAVGGSTVRDIEKQISDSEREILHPDVSFICVGINDIVRKFQGRDAEAVGYDEFVKRYTKAVDILAKRSRLVFCLGEPLVTLENATAINEDLEQYNAAIRNLAGQPGRENVFYIDLFSGFARTHSNISAHSPSDSLWIDGVHLSDIGNVLAADIIMRFLEREDIQRALLRLQSVERDEARKRYC